MCLCHKAPKQPFHHKLLTWPALKAELMAIRTVFLSLYTFSLTLALMHAISCLLKRGTAQSEDAHTVHMVCQSDEKGSNEAPISGAEMNLKRKCKLGENSAEMINWRVCNTEQWVRYTREHLLHF